MQTRLSNRKKQTNIYPTQALGEFKVTESVRDDLRHYNLPNLLAELHFEKGWIL